MFDGKLMDKLKGKKKGDMHEMHKSAKLGVLGDLSKQASDAMSVKIKAKPSDMPEAMDVAKDKVEDVIKEMHTTDEMEDYDNEEGHEYEEEMEGYGEESEGSEPDLGEEFDESIEDFSNISPDELDARIEKLTAIREKMKVASMD